MCFKISLITTAKENDGLFCELQPIICFSVTTSEIGWLTMISKKTGIRKLHNCVIEPNCHPLDPAQASFCRRSCSLHYSCLLIYIVSCLVNLGTANLILAVNFWQYVCKVTYSTINKYCFSWTERTNVKVQMNLYINPLHLQITHPDTEVSQYDLFKNHVYYIFRCAFGQFN